MCGGGGEGKEERGRGRVGGKEESLKVQIMRGKKLIHSKRTYT